MNQQNLRGKIAVITGGSRGLGRDMALRLAQQGADVMFTYRQNSDAAQATLDSLSTHGHRSAAFALDVSDVSSFDSFLTQVSQQLSEWGRDSFDFLINNAGHGAHAMITGTSEETFDQLVNVHFKGVYFLTQKALPLLADHGRIVNVSTGLTRFTFPGYAAYASMKGAIEVFTRYLAKELGARGITANAVAPGAIDNDFNKHAFEANPQVKQVIASQTALGRVGNSEDIGGVVAFLCSPEAGWVNGQRIEASGGMFL